MAKDKIADFVRKHTFSAQDIIAEEKESVKLGPRLQELTGGIRWGSGVMMSGKEGCGKTTTSLHIAAKAQDQFDSTIWYLNSECRLAPRDFQGCFGFNADQEKFKVIQPQVGEILYAEDYINSAKHIMETEDNCVIIVDSLSNLSPKDLLDEDITRRYRSTMPNIMSNFSMACASLLRKQIILIYIVHEMANVDPRSYTKFIQKGGNAIRYMVNYNMRIYSNKDWVEGDQTIGQINSWKILKTATSIKNETVESKFRYGLGVDEFGEMLDMASELAIVQKKGGGYYAYNGENFARGEAAAIQHLRDNQDMYTDIETQVMEILE